MNDKTAPVAITDEQIFDALWTATGRDWKPDAMPTLDTKIGYIYSYADLIGVVRALLSCASQADKPVANTKEDVFCDSHCTWLDHHPECVRAGDPAPYDYHRTMEAIAAAVEIVGNNSLAISAKAFWKIYGAAPVAQQEPKPLSPDVLKDTERLNFLDRNERFRMGWQVNAAPVGNLSVQSIIMGGKPIREAIDAAMSLQSTKEVDNGT